MSYETRWKLDKQTTRKVFRQIVKDFRTILPHLEIKKGLLRIEDAHGVISSGYIRDHITLNDEYIMFNTQCLGEVFTFARIGYFSQSNSCKTYQLPFDLAVNCALLIAKKHLKHEIHIYTDGVTKDWRKALLLCQYVLGDEYHYMHITEKNSMVRYRWWDMAKNSIVAQTYINLGFQEERGLFIKSIHKGHLVIAGDDKKVAPKSLDQEVELTVHNRKGTTVETAWYLDSHHMIKDDYFNWLVNL
jgi:hypothetical protein